MNDDSGTIPFLAEARSGDRAGLGRLAKLVWQRIYPFVFRTTLDRHATEDIIQDTLLTMLRRLHSLRNTKRFWPWIYRIAWNKIQDRLRDRRLQSSLKSTLLRRRNAAGESTDFADNPLDAKICEETLQQVCDAVERLNHRQREILRLRCHEQLPYDEIASLTCTTPEKARIHFHRAKKSLKKCLACCS